MVENDSAFTKWLGPILFLSLIPLAALIENALISAKLGLGISLLLIVIAGAWSFRSTGRWTTIGELYLWLAFILAVYHLKFVADWFAVWFDIDSFIAFQVVAVAHVALVIFILQRFGAWSLNGMSSDNLSSLICLAAGLFVCGAVVFWVGARTFQGTSLDVIAANPTANFWTSANFIIATVITLFALAIFSMVLQDSGERLFARLGLLCYAFGAVFWILHLAYRLTVLDFAAQEWRIASVAPAWFEPWRAWAALLFAIYSILAYVGLAAYGAAILRTNFLPRWTGWMCVFSGIVAGALGGLPLFIHIPLWIIGILVLRAAALQNTKFPFFSFLG